MHITALCKVLCVHCALSNHNQVWCEDSDNMICKSEALFYLSLSVQPLKKQTRCTLVQQAVLFAPHSFSLAYLYRGLQEIGEGSIFSQVVLLVNTQL